VHLKRTIHKSLVAAKDRPMKDTKTTIYIADTSKIPDYVIAFVLDDIKMKLQLEEIERCTAIVSPNENYLRSDKRLNEW